MVSKERIERYVQRVKGGSRVESESADETDVYHFDARRPIARISWIIGAVPVDHVQLLGAGLGSACFQHCVVLGCHIVTDRVV